MIWEVLVGILYSKVQVSHRKHAQIFWQNVLTTKQRIDC